MAITKTQFKSATSEKRWVELQKEKTDLLSKQTIITPAIQAKLDTLSCLMTSCKVGFDLSEARVKKVMKFLKEKTGGDKFKYGILPDDIKHQGALFKDVVIAYVEKDGVIIFKEANS